MTLIRDLIADAVGEAEGAPEADRKHDVLTADAVLRKLAEHHYEVRYAGHYTLHRDGSHDVVSCPCPSCEAHRINVEKFVALANLSET